tara:strand:+ start:361 stop:729 length:369 start_codon:yes stop_codon:yes gene_type:complete
MLDTMQKFLNNIGLKIKDADQMRKETNEVSFENDKKFKKQLSNIYAQIENAKSEKRYYVEVHCWTDKYISTFIKILEYKKYSVSQLTNRLTIRWTPKLKPMSPSPPPPPPPKRGYGGPPYKP